MSGERGEGRMRNGRGENDERKRGEGGRDGRRGKDERGHTHFFRCNVSLLKITSRFQKKRLGFKRNVSLLKVPSRF